MGKGQKLKVYCETSFWSYLAGGATTNEKIARCQWFTHRWWDEISPKCEVYISQYVIDEAEKGNAEKAERRGALYGSARRLDGMVPEANELAEELRAKHAIPEDEATDSLHIATAAIYGIDVLLTWNCRHLANPVTLPKTASIVARAGYECPVIITPEEFFTRLEEFEL